ncbi:hypothetical protein [Lacinutrix sp. Hel_I_90]|nr:hypothetical protein [Lacinutrix sp. Hel_I_90]
MQNEHKFQLDELRNPVSPQVSAESSSMSIIDLTTLLLGLVL